MFSRPIIPRFALSWSWRTWIVRSWVIITAFFFHLVLRLDRDEKGAFFRSASQFLCRSGWHRFDSWLRVSEPAAFFYWFSMRSVISRLPGVVEMATVTWGLMLMLLLFAEGLQHVADCELFCRKRDQSEPEPSQSSLF